MWRIYSSVLRISISLKKLPMNWNQRASGRNSPSSIRSSLRTTLFGMKIPSLIFSLQPWSKSARIRLFLKFKINMVMFSFSFSMELAQSDLKWDPKNLTLASKISMLLSSSWLIKNQAKRCSIVKLLIELSLLGVSSTGHILNSLDIWLNWLIMDSYWVTKIWKKVLQI